MFGLDLTDQMTFKEAFRRAKQQLRITKHINTPKPVHVYDKQDENRAVWAFKGDYQRKSPLNPGKYNQHDGHIPENSKGISNIKRIIIKRDECYYAK